MFVSAQGSDNPWRHKIKIVEVMNRLLFIQCIQPVDKSNFIYQKLALCLIWPYAVVPTSAGQSKS